MNYPQNNSNMGHNPYTTKHKDLLGFVLNPNSITCILTMNPTSKGGFHTLDPIRIYSRVRFLTTHNPQTCIIQTYTKFHTKIQRSILESILIVIVPYFFYLPFFFSSLLLLFLFLFFSLFLFPSLLYGFFGQIETKICLKSNISP